MTAQIGDKFWYKNSKYSIVAISEPIRFDPHDHGITPAAVCTACWAGYWCEYRIDDTGVFLEKLFINSADGVYPPINGIHPIDNDDHFRYMGHHLYDGLNIRIPYTGKILVGDGFLDKYYIHMGYQRAWAYKKLVEFVFEDGMLKEQNDHSKTAAHLREQIDNDTALPGRKTGAKNIAGFVGDSFALDYGTKAWWL